MEQQPSKPNDVVQVHSDNEYEQVWIYCKGCKHGHAFTTRQPSNYVWTWNGDRIKPTFSPSLLVCPDDPTCRCHSFVVDGNIQYLQDCFHELKGQTIPLESPETLI